MVRDALDISTDPCCGRAMNPDVAPSYSSDPDIIMTSVAEQVTQIWMLPGPWTLTCTQVADLTLGILMALGGNRCPICQSRPWAQMMP